MLPEDDRPPPLSDEPRLSEQTKAWLWKIGLFLALIYISYTTYH